MSTLKLVYLIGVGFFFLWAMINIVRDGWDPKWPVLGQLVLLVVVCLLWPAFLVYMAWSTRSQRPY